MSRLDAMPCRPTAFSVVHQRHAAGWEQAHDVDEQSSRHDGVYLAVHVELDPKRGLRAGRGSRGAELPLAPPALGDDARAAIVERDAARWAGAESPEQPVVLLTGASGYVGGRLLDRLLAERHRVRFLVRDRFRLARRAGLDVVEADVRDAGALAEALRGVDVAVYLVHSLEIPDFERADREAAQTFAASSTSAASATAGSRRTCSSRQEVGRVLRDSGVETIEFRASSVIGAGSRSFQLVRSLVERLPVMVTPRWVETPAQPIAIDDVVGYLAAAVDAPLAGSRIFEIGGRAPATYGGLMREYARQ